MSSLNYNVTVYSYCPGTIGIGVNIASKFVLNCSKSKQHLKLIT